MYFIIEPLTGCYSRVAKSECLRTGEWDKQCVKIECSSIPSVWSELYTCTDGVNSGSTCTATCPTTQVSIHRVN